MGENTEKSKNNSRNGLMKFLSNEGYDKQQSHAIINQYVSGSVDLPEEETETFTKRCVFIQKDYMKFVAHVQSLK